MLGAILLILIGSADLVRANLASTKLASTNTASIIARLCVISLVWLALLFLSLWGLGLAPWAICIPAVLALAWVASTTASETGRTKAGALPAVGVLVALLCFLVWDRTALGAAGFIVDWHANATSAVISALPLAAIAVSIGIVLFAIESSNIVVRTALRPALQPAVAVVEPARGRPVSSARWRRTVAIAPSAVDLRGGRLIGPVERVLIMALTLAGALPIVAGLIAAKGIVRFPEISQDNPNGSKAEYFLVGSLVSWAIAIAGAGFIWISAQG